MRQDSGVSSSDIYKRFTLFWLMSFLGVWVFALLMPTIYAEPDDPGLVLMMQQGFHVPFVGLAQTRLLSALYHQFPNLPWYGMYHYTLLSLVLALVAMLVSKLSLPVRWRWTMGVMLAWVLTNFIIKITFSYTAILLVGTALTTFGAVLRCDQPLHRRLLPALLLGVVLALGWMTRLDSIKVAIFLVPLYIALFVDAVRRQPPADVLKQWLACGLAFCLPLLVLAVIQTRVLRLTPAEQSYRTYLQDVGARHGFAFTDWQALKPRLARMGWSENDYRMFKTWFYIHEDKFSLDKVRELPALSPPVMQQQLGEVLTPSHLPNELYEMLDHGWFRLNKVSFAFLGLFLLALALADSRKKRGKLLVYVAYILGGILLMQGLLRFPPRVGLPLYFTLTLTLLTWPGIAWEHLASQWRVSRPVQLALGVSVVLFAIGLGITVDRYFDNARHHKKFIADRAFVMDKLNASLNSYLLRSHGLIHTQKADPLEVTPLPAAEIGPGWLVNSPVFNRRLRELGLKPSQLWPWMLDNPHAYFLLRPKEVGWVCRFYAETYQKQGLTAVVAGELPGHPGTGMYQFQSSPPAQSGGQITCDEAPVGELEPESEEG